MTYHLKYACFSEKGKRKKNQDNLLLDGRYLECIHTELELQKGELLLEHPYTFGVFDGLGGGCDGETASWLTAKCLSEHMQEIHEKDNPFQIKKYIGKICLKINEEICRYAKEHKYSSMGTTLAGITIFQDNVYGYNLGDSRIYHFSESGLEQCSRDHVANNIIYHPGLTQYLGIPKREFVICPDTFFKSVKEKDFYLICTDGITNLLSDEIIEDILISYSNPEEALGYLKLEAEEIGLRDNTTAILVQIEKE